MNAVLYAKKLAGASYNDSVEFCEQTGGKLVEIQTPQQQADVESFVKSLDSDLKKKGSFYIDLKRVDFDRIQPVSRYIVFQSDYFIYGSKCVDRDATFQFIEKGAGCSYSFVEYYFLCVYPNACPLESFLPSEPRCYKKILQKLTWYEARNYCVERGGDLADFLKSMMERVYKVTSGSNFWIGYSHIRWFWKSEPDYFANYTNWYRGYESTELGDANKCVIMDVNDMKWRVQQCFNITGDAINVVVCMEENDATTTTTTSTTTTTTSKETSSVVTTNEPKETKSNSCDMGLLVAIVFIAVIFGISIGFIICCIKKCTCSIKCESEKETNDNLQETYTKLVKPTELTTINTTTSTITPSKPTSSFTPATSTKSARKQNNCGIKFHSKEEDIYEVVE